MRIRFIGVTHEPSFLAQHLQVLVESIQRSEAVVLEKPWSDTPESLQPLPEDPSDSRFMFKLKHAVNRVDAESQQFYRDVEKLATDAGKPVHCLEPPAARLDQALRDAVRIKNPLRKKLLPEKLFPLRFLGVNLNLFKASCFTLAILNVHALFGLAWAGISLPGILYAAGALAISSLFVIATYPDYRGFSNFHHVREVAVALGLRRLSELDEPPRQITVVYGTEHIDRMVAYSDLIQPPNSACMV